jgi:chromosome segregation ATPase
MDDLESKIALYKQKEDSYMKTASDAKIKVEEAYLERDRIALKEQQYVKQIERLQENLRVERNTQKIKIDELVESLRNQFKKIIDDRDEEIKILRDKMNTLSLQCDRLTRENSSLKSEVDRYENILQEEQKRLDARLTEYEKRFKEAEETRLTEKRLLEEQAQSFSFQRQEWDTLRRTFEQRISLLTRDVENYNSTSMRNHEDAKRARSQLDDVLRERDSLANELNSLRDSYYEKLQESATDFNHKIYSLEQQLTEAREKQRESENKSWELVKKQEKVSEKWREEVKQLYNYYERVVGELNDEIRRISSKGEAADVRQKLVF